MSASSRSSLPSVAPAHRADAAQFARIDRALSRALADLEDRTARELRSPARDGQERLERDAEVHRLESRRRLLSRVSRDVCLGRIVPADGSAPRYIGRIGLSDEEGRPVLVDWRSPAAEPFFAATRARPLGLAARRRYRWRDGELIASWDESFLEDGSPGGAAPGDQEAAVLDEDSAFLASLAEARTPRMRDVLATIAADQDAIIRADARHPLVVDGGPGTGKTVVALHRAAYLSYADVRLRERGGGILVLGPHRPYLDHIADVLPGLGEDEVRTAVLRDLVPESADALPEPDPEVAALKADARMVAAIEPAVALYEEPPQEEVRLEIGGAEVVVDAADWADAFAAVEPGTPHNAARPQIREELAEIVRARLEDAASYDADGRAIDLLQSAQILAALRRSAELTRALHRAWPLLEATDLVGDLWEVPAYLRRCAPWLTAAQRAMLRRPESRAWTDADLPLLDAARHRLGDARTERDRARREAARATAREQMAPVIDDLVAADGTEMRQMSMLRGEDMAEALLGEGSAAPEADLAGPYAHVIVDEAQELTDAQWAMVLRRCPSRSLTIVGDRAQAGGGFAGTWAERLDRVGIGRVRQEVLHVNYRTPQEVMDVAAPVIRAAVPDANVPLSIRETGIPVRHGTRDELAGILAEWTSTHPAGTACVIGADLPAGTDPRVRALSPLQAKGLEFDLVVLVEPEALGEGRAGASARYVAMTRSTRELVILSRG